MVKFWQISNIALKSSHQRCSMKKAVLNNLAILIKKYLCWSLFLINLQAYNLATLSQRDSNTGVFLWILQKFWKPVSKDICERLPLTIFAKHFILLASQGCEYALIKLNRTAISEDLFLNYILSSHDYLVVRHSSQIQNTCLSFQIDSPLEDFCVKIGNPAFCLFLYLTGLHFRGEL